MKRLREAPTSSGRPNDLSSPSRAIAVMLCSGVLPKPIPGSSTIVSRAMPARSAMSSERAKNAAMSAMMSIAGSAASRLCMMMTGTPCSATTPRHIGVALQAPDVVDDARRQLRVPRRATPAFMVSIETGTPSAVTAGRTGASRRSSSSGETAPRRHRGGSNSAPMSRMSAPSAARRRACSIARCGSRKRPPSEKQSGVTLSTPITTGRPRLRSRASRPVAGRACVPAGSGDDVFGRALVTVVALRRSARGSQDAPQCAHRAQSARDTEVQMWRRGAQ